MSDLKKEKYPARYLEQISKESDEIKVSVPVPFKKKIIELMLKLNAGEMTSHAKRSD